jgi:DNA invertase Pin-like site-specific DNA recombinase
MRELRRHSLLLPRDGQSIEIREPARNNPRLAVYDRRSRATDTSVSLARQREESEALAESLGGIYDPERDFFFDDDISARGGKYRPGMEALLRHVKNGEYDGVVSYELHRMLRNTREAGIFKELMKNAPCDIYTVRHRGLSLFGPMSLVFDILVDQAAAESQSTSDRVASWHAYMRKLGAARSVAPFGMRKTLVDMDIEGRAAPIAILTPDEQPREELAGRSPAEIVREIAQRIVDGQSLSTVVTWLNTSEIPSPRGGLWTRQTVSLMMRNPSLAGYAHANRKLIGADGELLSPGSTETPLRVSKPILDDGLWSSLYATMSTRQARPRSHVEALLRGLMRCGKCGSLMRMSKDRWGGAYRCSRRQDTGRAGCSGNTVAARKSEAYVIAAVVELLNDPDLLASARAANAPQAQQALASLESTVATIDAQLEELEAMWLNQRAADSHARARFERHRNRLASQLTAATKELNEHVLRHRKPVLGGLADGASVGDAITALPQHAKTTILLELISHVVVHPAQHRGRAFHVERLEIVWQPSDA